MISATISAVSFLRRCFGRAIVVHYNFCVPQPQKQTHGRCNRPTEVSCKCEAVEFGSHKKDLDFPRGQNIITAAADKQTKARRSSRRPQYAPHSSVIFHFHSRSAIAPGIGGLFPGAGRWGEAGKENRSCGGKRGTVLQRGVGVKLM